jgi:hypothetical protein
MMMLIMMTIKGMRADMGISMSPLNGMEGSSGHNPTKAKMLNVTGMVTESKATKLTMLK